MYQETHSPTEGIDSDSAPSLATPAAPTKAANPLAACPHLANPSRLARVNPVASGNATASAFSRYVVDGNHPCVMARSVVNRKQVFLASYGALGEASNGAALCHDLYEVLKASEAEGGLYTLVAVFPDQVFSTEQAFEDALWEQLKGVHEVDKALFDWDPSVSADPESPDFSFSVGGAAWYVVGLHPAASRLSRRFKIPALVFNRHQQFEVLREEGRYDGLRDRIRERDVSLQGSVNPMLKNHGEASEALQYAGRRVDGDWRCPF